MKKILFALLAAVALLTGCQKEDETPKFDYDMDILYGTWVVKEVDTGNGYKDWPMTKTTATFNADGTYSGSGYFGNGSGTYEAVGKTITCYIQGEEYMKYDVLALSGKSCELKMYKTGADSYLKIKCAKE